MNFSSLQNLFLENCAHLYSSFWSVSTFLTNLPLVSLSGLISLNKMHSAVWWTRPAKKHSFKTPRENTWFFEILFSQVFGKLTRSTPPPPAPPPPKKNKTKQTKKNHCALKLYKFGWHTFANNQWLKNSKDLILGKVVFIAFIYRLWSHGWWKPRIVSKRRF